MAIHIKELNVTLHIGEASNENLKDMPSNQTSSSCCSDESKKQTLEETVREVMRILDEQKER